MWKTYVCYIFNLKFVNISLYDEATMSNNGTPMIQAMHSNAFTLTGNTQATQIASMTGTICQTDWLTIPCAFNTGRLPTNMMTCIDRICGGTFNAENQNLNASSIISKYIFIFLSDIFLCFLFFKSSKWIN